MILMLLLLLLLVLLLYYPLMDLYLIYIRGMPPGPISLPLIGNLHLLNPTTPHLSVDSLYKQYGSPFSLRMGPYGRAIFVGGLKEIDDLYNNPSAKNRPKLHFIDIINNGADGFGSCNCPTDRWKYLVKLFMQGQSKFSNANLSKNVQPYFTQLMQRFEDNTGKEYDTRDDIMKCCSAIFSSIIYGIDTSNLDSEDLHSRIKHHNTIMSCLNPAHIMNILPILWKIPSTLKNNILACIQSRDEMLSESLQSHIEDDSSELRDIMDIVAHSVNHNSGIMEQKGITDKDMLLSTWTFYLAGCDTVVDCISWILLYLSINPVVQTQIRTELEEVLSGKDDDILDKKASLHYTRAAILESLRLSSPIAMGIPYSNNTDIKLSGFHIPQESLIMPTHWTLHHDENLWPEPFKLKPERFLDKDGTLFSMNYIFKKMPFIPFSRGIRVCLGQYMALDILLIFVCKTLQTYGLQLPENYTPDLNGEIMVGLRPKSFPLLFQRRHAQCAQ